ncbi:MAG: hypothetical protein M1817_004637 [Caeruleum heppii]|nr:MAG: hypothetical protein M1817_004637 [Caeruleum heppii]
MSGLVRPLPRAHEISTRNIIAEVAREFQREESRRIRDTNVEPPSNAAPGLRPSASSTGGAGASQESPTGESDQTGPEHDLKILVQPPGEARPNHPLYPPFTVQLSAVESDSESAGAGNLSGVWGFASLTNGDGSRVLAPPRIDLISGNLVDSAHPLTGDDGWDEAIDGAGLSGRPGSDKSTSYLMFPGLKIRQPGEYRIRVTLVRMSGGAASPPASPHGAESLESVQSRIIRVDEASASLNLGKFARRSKDAEEQETLEMLRGRGVGFPSPSF